MKFLQKRSVAVTLTVLMVLVSLIIGFRGTGSDVPDVDSTDWAAEHYRDYEYTVRDESSLLDESDIRTIAACNAAADHAYGTVCALVTTDQLPAGEENQYAEYWFERLDLRETDMLLLLSEKEQAWWLLPGYDMDWYVDSDLEDIFYDAEDALLAKPAAALPDLYEELARWYEGALPREYQTSDVSLGGFLLSAFGVIVFILVIVALLIALGVITASRTVGRTVRGPRVYYTGPIIHHRPHVHRPSPGPTHRPPPGPGRPSRPSGSSRSGFGSSSRPSGGRSGFGSGSRPSGGSRGGGSRGGFGGRR